MVVEEEEVEEEVEEDVEEEGMVEEEEEEEEEEEGFTNPVDVADSRWGEVIVDDQVDTFEIYSSPHQVRAD